MSIWKTPFSFETINERQANSISEYLGIEFTGKGDDYLTAKMPVDHRTKQPIGIMHGGSSCVLAETVGSVAANFAVDLDKQFCVGLSINTNHIRAVKDGFVHGTARPQHLGKTTQVWNVKIVDDDGKLVSNTQLTMMVMNR